MDLVTMLLACSLASDNSITQAMVEVGSKNQPLMVSTVGGDSKIFPTEKAAINYAQQELQQGHSIKVGLMQIPNRWLEAYRLHLSDVFRPCKNMVVATRIVNDLRSQCLIMKRTPPITDMQACALSMYETGDPTQGKDYADKVMEYAKAHPFVPPEMKLNVPTKPKANPEKTDDSKSETKAPTVTTVPTTETDNQND